MVFTSEDFFEVSLKRWPELNLNPRPIEFRLDALNDWIITAWVQLALRSNFVQLLQFHLLLSVIFYFSLCLRISPCLFELKFCWGNHMSVADSTENTNVIHHWRILWSRYRKLTWVGFKPTTTEFCSDTLVDWAIRPWVQLSIRSNFAELL